MFDRSPGYYVILIALVLIILPGRWALAVKVAGKVQEHVPLYTYTLAAEGPVASYDEALAVACLQGVINRDGTRLYVLSQKQHRPQYWLDILSKDGRWLEGRSREPVADLDGLVKLAGRKLKGVVIWDPAVPATVNVATTMAGVEDAVVLSPELAGRYLAGWKLPVLRDFRGQFKTKNEAYRWAIEQYLAKGACSSQLLCLFEDAFSTRAKGDIGYVVTRDWAVKNRAFVFDLSPWADEVPGDDPQQKLGLDQETYKTILAETLKHAAGKHMTELTGFFAFSKYSKTADHQSKHEGVPTEWQSVWLMSPYNCYQNTISSECYNQSLHSQAPRKQLTQRSTAARDLPLEKKAYVCFLMADYDSATPLYEFLPQHWHDKDRGKMPFLWGTNPSLLNTYPDLIAYFYETATPMDTFASDASAAGYMNPNRIRPEYLPLFVEHNRKLFNEAGMTMAPMVLDQDQPSPAVKDAFVQFAPDGFATIVQDEHAVGGHLPKPQVWKGMPVMELINEVCNSEGKPQVAADAIVRAIANRGTKMPGFYFFRVVWVNPSNVIDAMAIVQKQHPELNVEVLDAKSFFSLFRKSL